MKTLVLFLGAAIVVYLAVESVRVYGRIQTSRQLVEAAVPYALASDDARVPMLVLGDSTAVGVGAANPEESLGGLVASFIGATSVENYARSGAVTEELKKQAEKANRFSYDLILIQIGGNDIIRFKDSDAASAELTDALKALPKSKRVIVLSAGNVGGAPLFPFFLRPFYTRENISYHAAFERATVAAGYTYVNLYTAPNGKLIEQDPETYLAADGLHPSSAGYALWFDALRPALGLPVPR